MNKYTWESAKGNLIMMPGQVWRQIQTLASSGPRVYLIFWTDFTFEIKFLNFNWLFFLNPFPLPTTYNYQIYGAIIPALPF